MKPLCIDLFCGLGGWTDGFLAEGYDVIGFDVERHDYGTGGYPGQLVLQDALTLHGSQFRNAACIVASPPCQEYSYMAMPWKRAKQIATGLRGGGEFPEGYAGSRTLAELTALFDACFRIQREAIEATGHACPACDGLGPRHSAHVCPRCNGTCWVTRHIPLVVENVKGAQPWVGKAQAAFGSFYLWGDVRSVGGRIVSAHRVEFGTAGVKAMRGSKNGIVGGGSWFATGSPGQKVFKGNPDGRKVPMNFHEHEKTGKPGRSFQSAAVESSGVKRMSGLHGLSHPDGKGGRDLGGPNDPRRFNSASPARKAASAQIAKIPFELAAHIARCFKPNKEQVA